MGKDKPLRRRVVNRLTGESRWEEIPVKRSSPESLAREAVVAYINVCAATGIPPEDACKAWLDIGLDWHNLLKHADQTEADVIKRLKAAFQTGA